MRYANAADAGIPARQSVSVSFPSTDYTSTLPYVNPGYSSEKFCRQGGQPLFLLPIDGHDLTLRGDFFIGTRLFHRKVIY